MSNMRGTTRDAIDTDVKLPDGRKFKLIDTAGIRKRVAIKCMTPPAICLRCPYWDFTGVLRCLNV